MKRLRERAAVCAGSRRFFDARGFVEVQTPVVVPSPGLDVHLDAFEVTGGDRGAPRWLSTSPEYQMKRLLAAGWARATTPSSRCSNGIEPAPTWPR
jgi:lysyl-tRNA synthetase class 2